MWESTQFTAILILMSQLKITANSCVEQCRKIRTYEIARNLLNFVLKLHNFETHWKVDTHKTKFL